MNTDNKPSLAVSACLLGQEVRFDGGHKHDRYLTKVLSEHFQLLPVCPEVAIGLGTPREPIRLVDEKGNIRVKGTKDPELDVTEKLQAYAQEQHQALQGISGYIVKRSSPSCGMERVKTYTPQGMPVGNAPGMYTQTLMALWPLLPVEEEGRLHDAGLRESFLTRVYTYERWQRLLRAGVSTKALVEFHTEHKWLLMARNQTRCRELGQMVAAAGGDIDQLAHDYIHGVMSLLKKPLGRRGAVNVLQHWAGFLGKSLERADRLELAQCIEEYRQGEMPLAAPLTLMRHYMRSQGVRHRGCERFLQPAPVDLALRYSF